MPLSGSQREGSGYGLGWHWRSGDMLALRDTIALMNLLARCWTSSQAANEQEEKKPVPKKQSYVAFLSRMFVHYETNCR